MCMSLMRISVRMVVGFLLMASAARHIWQKFEDRESDTSRPSSANRPAVRSWSTRATDRCMSRTCSAIGCRSSVRRACSWESLAQLILAIAACVLCALRSTPSPMTSMWGTRSARMAPPVAIVCFASPARGSMNPGSVCLVVDLATVTRNASEAKAVGRERDVLGALADQSHDNRRCLAFLDQFRENDPPPECNRLKRATVTVPPGRSGSPSPADGLVGRSVAEPNLGTLGAACPEASKIGTGVSQCPGQATVGACPDALRLTSRCRAGEQPPFLQGGVYLTGPTSGAHSDLPLLSVRRPDRLTSARWWCVSNFWSIRGCARPRSSLTRCRRSLRASHRTGKGQTTDGKHPGVNDVLNQRRGDANLKRVSVGLPSRLRSIRTTPRRCVSSPMAPTELAV